jgi:hypothetical protein
MSYDDDEAAWRKDMEAQQKLKADVEWRIGTVLRSFGIKAKIGGCGCCGSPWIEAEFPDGTKADLEHFAIDTFDVQDKTS